VTENHNRRTLRVFEALGQLQSLAMQFNKLLAVPGNRYVSVPICYVTDILLFDTYSVASARFVLPFENVLLNYHTNPGKYLQEIEKKIWILHRAVS